MGKSIFHGILIATPILFIILYFSLTGKEEVKAEARVRSATQALQQQQFDNNFSDAWNGRPRANSKEMKARDERIAELKDVEQRAVQKRDGLDAQFDDLKDGMDQALQEEDMRLSGKQPKAKLDDLDPRLAGENVK